MKNSKALFLDLVNQIDIDEHRDEIQSMVYLLLEDIFSLSKADILSEMEFDFGDDERKRIGEMVSRINRHEPIQYILGETEFYGRNFRVNNSVLIPRPETEELVRLVLVHLTNIALQGRTGRTLDIGTGSGCIPITLALEIPNLEVFATDVSPDAIEVARENALRFGARAQFFINDVLQEKLPVRNLDVVVSNPPYISMKEKENMKSNVLDFEPHLALFVSDEDPLLFYRVIVEKSRHALVSNGLLAVEINECFGVEVASLFKAHGYTDVGIVRDLSGKERIVKGIVP